MSRVRQLHNHIWNNQNFDKVKSVMDWLLATPQLYSAFSSLGCLEGDTYVVNPNALGE